LNLINNVCTKQNKTTQSGQHKN